MIKKLRDFLPLTAAVLSMAADVLRSLLSADVKTAVQRRDGKTKRGSRGTADRGNVVRSRGRKPPRHH
jgi:hypothetical protein